MKTWVRNCLFALALCGMIDCLSYGGISSATFEESLDYPSLGSGPLTFLKDASVGGGIELSGANVVDNPSNFNGYLEVDLDGNVLTLTHRQLDPNSPNAGTDYQTATVNLSGIVFDVFGQQIADVQLVGNSIIDAQNSDFFTESLSFTNNSISLNWFVDLNTVERFNFFPGGTATYQITLSNVNTIPEPSTLGIFAFFAVGAAVTRRRGIFGAVTKL